MIVGIIVLSSGNVLMGLSLEMELITRSLTWSIGFDLTIVGVVIIGTDIIGVIVAFIRSKKEKGSDIDERMKKIFLLSIVLTISGWTLFIILIMLLGIFLSYNINYLLMIVPFFPFLFLGLLIGFIGLYGIRLYRSRPEKLRNYLLNRRK